MTILAEVKTSSSVNHLGDLINQFCIYLGSMPISCLNCSTEFSGTYCPNCAQKASTRRFTLRQVFSSDFLSETLNLNRGLLHTCWHLIIRPGNMVRDYLAGHRKKYFNFIGFLIILLAVEAVLWQFGHNSLAQIVLDAFKDQLAKSDSDIAMTLSIADVETVLRNQKLSFLLIVPLSALGTWLIFKRTGYSYAEHIVSIVFLLAMNTLLGFTIGLIGLLPLEFDLFKLIYYLFSVVVLGYGLWFYWQFSQQAKYSKAGRIWRVIAGYLVVILILSLGQQVFMGIAAGSRTAGEQPATEILE